MQKGLQESIQNEISFEKDQRIMLAQGGVEVKRTDLEVHISSRKA
jgi:hypothetical protein